MRKKVLHISLKRVPKIYVCVLRHGLMLYNFFGLALKQCLHKVLLFANLLNFLYFKSYSLFHLNFLQPGSNFTLTSKTLTNRHEVGVNFLSSVFFLPQLSFSNTIPSKKSTCSWNGRFSFYADEKFHTNWTGRQQGSILGMHAKQTKNKISTALQVLCACFQWCHWSPFNAAICAPNFPTLNLF